MDERKQAEIEAAWRAYGQQPEAQPSNSDWLRLVSAPPGERLPGSVLRLLRALVASEQNHRCCYCGIRTNEARTRVDGATLEHVLPRAEGGTDTYDNLVMACLGCNEGRGSSPLGPRLTRRQRHRWLERYRLGY